MRATATTVVKKPVDHVWSVLADHEGMANWGPGMKVTLDNPGSPTPGGVGTVRRISAPGPMPAIVEEITVFEPGKRLGYKALSGVPFKNYHGEVVLSPVAGGTKIDYSVSLDLPVIGVLPATAVAQTLMRLLARAARG
ncbi:MAG: SRPBCC family protein [Propionibacteriales bacterium]|nr:SRPBCC family protein [Propionibacteriales bacterium]